MSDSFRKDLIHTSPEAELFAEEFFALITKWSRAKRMAHDGIILAVSAQVIGELSQAVIDGKDDALKTIHVNVDMGARIKGRRYGG